MPSVSFRTCPQILPSTCQRGRRRRDPRCAPSRSTPSVTPRSGRATVGHPAAQARWLSTLALMEQEPDSDSCCSFHYPFFHHRGCLTAAPHHSRQPRCSPTLLRSMRMLKPYGSAYTNTFILVLSSSSILSPPSLSDLLVQPLHVIIKSEKKPRVVVDLSRNLNAHLEYEYFQYSCVDDAVEASYPGCWYGKLDLTNCFLSFPLRPSVRRYFCFRFEGSPLPIHSYAFRPQHRPTCVHSTPLGGCFRSQTGRYPPRPLPGRLLPHRRLE